MHDRHLPTPTLAPLALALALTCPQASAQAVDDRARADALFREGQDLMTAGQVASACTKLEESQRIDPKLGRLLNVAYCHAQAGRVASAWGEYNQAAALALQTGQSERETFARTQASELALKLSFLRVDLGAAPEVSEVTLDGKALARDQCAAPFPIDPGSHMLTFAAPGRQPRTQTVTVSGPGTLRIAIDPLDAVQTAQAPAATVPATAAFAESPQPARPAGGDRVPGWIVAGLGGVALGVGTVFALRAVALRNEADPECPNRRCTPHGQSLIGDATTAATVADVGLAVGAIGLGIGGWLLLRPMSSAGASVALGGSW